MSELGNKKILVAGGAGYIGSHAVKRLLKEGFNVVVFDNFYRGYREPLEILKKYGQLGVVEGDLKNKEDIHKVFDLYQIDGVMHFAALCLVDESVREPEKYFENNVEGTINLLQAMSEHGVNNLVFSSTCAVYGNAEYLPIDERHPTHPTSPYGETKLMAEKIIQTFSDSHGVRYAILRYFNVCGADSEGEIGDSKKPSQLLVQNAVRGALGIEEFGLTCPEVDTEDGTPVRDYIDIEDLVDAHIKALQHLSTNKDSIILNLGTGEGYSVKQIIKEVKDELGVDFSLTKAPPRQGEAEKLYADIALAKNALDWSPQKTLKDSIRSLVLWYSKHKEGYKF